MRYSLSRWPLPVLVLCLAGISQAGILSDTAQTADGEQAFARFGASVAGAGDVNGDGYSDLIVGAPFHDNGEDDEGLACVFHGEPGGLPSAAGWTAEMHQAGAHLGMRVATAGDVNGDGYSDVLISAPDYNSCGRVFVFIGSPAGLSATPLWWAESDIGNPSFGHAIATAGDVNSDGFSEIIVGAPLDGSGERGRAYLYHGSAGGPSTVAEWIKPGTDAGVNFGHSVAAAGDVNGDGFSDVVVSSIQYENGQIGEGGLWVFPGSASGLSLDADWTAEGNQAGAGLGSAVAFAGDVNGDGYADLIAGAANQSFDQLREGAAHVYLGSAAGLSPVPDWTVESDQEDSRFGDAVASAGDINGDGYADLIVGAPAFDAGDTDYGRASVYLGSASGPETIPVWLATGEAAGDHYGISVAAAGDIDGDGLSDIVIGASLSDSGGEDAGRVYVYTGSTEAITPDEVWTVESDQILASYGHSVAYAGDVNGDGYADVLVSAIEHDETVLVDVGKVYLYQGSESGLSDTASWSYVGNQPGSAFGSSAAFAGDVNGDGYADVIVGDNLYDNPEVDEGIVRLFHGSASGLSASPNWSYESNQADAYLGISVATAGDVNGDGYADVIVGANRYTSVLANDGRAFLFLGSASGLPSAPDWNDGPDWDLSYYGFSVASAGDINADGYSDVIVGACFIDNVESNEGRIYVYHGSPGGLSASPNLTFEPNEQDARFGYSVSSAGDVNGDGFSDVIVGAPGYLLSRGRGFIYHGSPSGLITAQNGWEWYPERNFVAFGSSVATAGDVNGDGFSDVIASAPYYENEGTTSFNEGKVYLFLGSPTGLAGPVWTQESNQEDAHFGLQVGSAGDVNGDGYSDVIVGSPGFDNGENDEGKAYVYYGNLGRSLSFAPHQARADGAAPVQLLGSSGAEDGVRLRALARTPAGRTRVRLIYEFRPVGIGFDMLGLARGPWQDSGVTGNQLDLLVSGLGSGLPYHWRARLQYFPDLAYTRWWSTSLNGWEESDFRTGGSASCVPLGPDTTCDGVDDDCDGLFDDEADAADSCDDGLFCNGQETCLEGFGCQSGAVEDCDDSVACTTDSCNETTHSCDNIVNHGACADGLFCNGDETCHQINGCQPGIPMACDDGIACTADSCIEVDPGQCDFQPQDVMCDDGNVCTLNSCDPAQGCQVSFNNGVACSVGTCDGICQAGLCEGCICYDDAECDDLIACTADSCVGGACFNEPDHQLCDDGQWCNGAELCLVLIGCQSQDPPDCNDLVDCTLDSCNEAGNRCDHLSDSAWCDDGRYCNGVETCDLILDCQPGAAPDCADNFDCTTDSCDESGDSCSFAVSPDMCLIGTSCFSDGTVAPHNPCLGCQASHNPSDWSPLPAGEPCGQAVCQGDGWLIPAPLCDGLGNCQEGQGHQCETGLCNEDATSCLEGPGQNGELLVTKGVGTLPGTTLRSGSPEVVLRLTIQSDVVGGTLDEMTVSYPGLEYIFDRGHRVTARLYEDSNADGQVSDGQAELGSALLIDGRSQFTDLGFSFSTADQRLLLLELDVAGTVSAESAAVSGRSSIFGPALVLLGLLLAGTGLSRRKRIWLLALMLIGLVLVGHNACTRQGYGVYIYEAQATLDPGSDVEVSTHPGNTISPEGTLIEGETFFLDFSH